MLKSERDMPAWMEWLKRKLHPFEVSKEKRMGGYIRKAYRKRYHTNRTHYGSVWLEDGRQLDLSGWENKDTSDGWYIKLVVDKDV